MNSKEWNVMIEDVYIYIYTYNCIWFFFYFYFFFGLSIDWFNLFAKLYTINWYISLSGLMKLVQLIQQRL